MKWAGARAVPDFPFQAHPRLLEHVTYRTLCTFDHWPDTRTLRVFDPPTPVMIGMAIADPSCGRRGSVTAGTRFRCAYRADYARAARRMAQNFKWLVARDMSDAGGSANHVSSAIITMWRRPRLCNLERRQQNSDREQRRGRPHSIASHPNAVASPLVS